MIVNCGFYFKFVNRIESNPYFTGANGRKSELMYKVKWSDNRFEWVPSKTLRVDYPQMVIDYLTGKLQWCDETKP